MLTCCNPENGEDMPTLQLSKCRYTRSHSEVRFSTIIVLSHWPHVAQQVQQQVAELVSENVAGTVHTGHKLSNKLGHIFVIMTLSVRCCYAPRRLVAAHVASVKAL